MSSDSAQSPGTDARSAPRESLYLAAALYCEGSPVPVKIRNMSASGALVEGGVLPDTGTLVQLIRGGLIVHALVAWTQQSRCGLKFSGGVNVQQWRATPTNAEQQRVDEVVRLVKAGVVPLPVPGLSQSANNDQPPGPEVELCAALRRACELLDELGAVLASDSDIVTRYGSALQNLDIAGQVITAAEAIIASRSDLKTNAIKLDGLRRSADQALQRGC